MGRSGIYVFVAAVLFAVLTVSPVAGQDLSTIAPGLTGDKLCSLIKNQPNAAIDAIATGASKAYDQGQQAINNYAQAMGAAVMAASNGGCIDELFSGVNQAIMKGGYKVEAVTGKALAIGVAQGSASEGGQILAKATAIVICRGGAEASACAKAWAQAIQIDPKNGCAVLVKAFVQAQARCSKGKATTNVKSTVFKEPLGQCRAPGLDSGNGGSSSGPSGSASGSYTPSGSVTISQGPAQTIQYPWGTVTQGPGISSSVWATNGGSGKPGFPVYVQQGVNGQTVSFGRRKVLQAEAGVTSGTNSKLSFRKLLSAMVATDYWPWGPVTSNNAATAINNGNANGGVMANSASNAFGNGWGPVTANSAATAINNGNANGPVVANSVANAYGRKLKGANWGGYGPITANSAATAINNGNANGPVVANSVANAIGRKLAGADSTENWPFTGGWNPVTANNAATAINNGNANGGVMANSAANAFGNGWGPVTANSAATAINNGNANGPVVANSVANAYGRH